MSISCISRSRKKYSFVFWELVGSFNNDMLIGITVMGNYDSKAYFQFNEVDLHNTPYNNKHYRNNAYYF